MTGRTCTTRRPVTEIEATKPAPAGNEQPRAVAVLIHELTEALTATGNYLAAATRMLDAEADPPQAVLRDVLQKSLAQFSRATEAVRQLRKSLTSASARDP